MTYKRKLTLAIIGVLIVIALAIGLPFLSRPCENLLPNFSLSQLALSAVAFFVVFVALVLTILQFRKSMAKPLIKVAFNDEGQQHANLIYENGILKKELPPFWLINEGNSIARYFQIDFVIPKDVGKLSRNEPNCRQVEDGTYILTYSNDGKYTLFVNKAHEGSILNLAIDEKECFNLSKNSFEIIYRIYGDWAETQEGKLKVNIKRTQEVSDATG